MEGIGNIISRIKDYTDSHAVDVPNELLRYDTKRNGVISQVSVYRWFSSIGINLSNRNIQMLLLAYQKDGGVDVNKLISDIGSSSSFNKTICEQTPDCTAELLELARDLANKRQTVREILSPFDRQNIGHVNPDNFYRAFGASPVTRTIANCYASGDKIDYLRLSNDIYKVSKTQAFNVSIVIPHATPAFVALATYIKVREIDPRKNFSQIDRLNTGKMPRRQFAAALSSFGASLSPRDIEEISNSFAEMGHEMCNYNLFIRAVDEFVPPPPKAATNSGERKLQTPDTLFQAAKGTIIERRIEVDLHFSVLQREGFTGDEIPLNKFVRIISGMHIDMNYEEIEQIASLFRGNNGIRYRDFMQAVVSPNMSSRTVNSADVVSRLRDFLYESRQQLGKVASRYDRENSGNISIQQLSSVLQFVRFEATHQEAQSLSESFPGTERGLVSWRDLCAQFDQPMKPYEESPKKNEEQNYMINQSRITRPPVGSNPPPKHVVEVVNKLNSTVGDEGDLVIDLRKQDKLHLGFVSQQAFVNFIYALPITISPTELRTLVSYYRVSGSSDINYLQLEADAESIKQNAIETQRTMALSKPIELVNDPLPNIPQNIHSFLKRLKSYAEQKRFQPSNLFEPYDTLHNGTVAAYKVQACFAQVDFPVLKEEIEQITELFRDTKKPELFNYVTFNRAFNAEDINSIESRSSLSATPISHDIEREAATTCSQIREKLLARHRRIEIPFAGINTPTISTKEFQQRLSLIDFVIHASQINALIRKYRVNLTDEVNWKQFCDDVNNSKTI